MCSAFGDDSSQKSGDEIIAGLHQELAFARKIINTLHDSILILDANLKIQEANRSFFETFGVTPEETVGFSFPELGNGQWDNAELRDLLERVMSEEIEVRNFRLTHSFPEIGEQTMQLNARRLLAGQQRPLILLAITNVTTQHRATQELERFNTELIRSNEELERFAFLAAHDLQAPLQTIISYLTLMVERYEDRLDTDADDFFQFTINSAAHLQHMTRGLLALARVNHDTPHFESVDLQQVVDTALGNLIAAIEACGAAISNDPLPTVLGDKAQLTQLFQNLIDNAIKFRGESPPEIHIGIEERDTEWVFSVQDDGIGIEPDYIEDIFELFRRAHHQEDYAGSGIGLTIAKKIVERHRGRIWVESTPGVHTVFYFSLAKHPSSQLKGA